MFVLSDLLFCGGGDATQCITLPKTLSVAVVLAGLLMYYRNSGGVGKTEERHGSSSSGAPGNDRIGGVVKVPSGAEWKREGDLV